MLCFHAAQTGKHFLRTQNDFEQNQKHFLCPGTQNLCPQQMLRARADGETFVSATMGPQQYVLVCQGLYNARAEPLFCSLKVLFSVVPVAVAVVVFLNSLFTLPWRCPTKKLLLLWSALTCKFDFLSALYIRST